MDDPVQRHPTRAEQLDILATIVAARTPADGDVLDLGCGVGYVADLIFRKQENLSITGVDRNVAALESARTNLAGYGGTFTGIPGDLENIGQIDIPGVSYNVIYTALTFHDLPDAAKQAVIRWVAGKLAPGGFFLLYDRLRLTEPALFPLQGDIWTRIEATYGVAMRNAPDYPAYLTDLGTDNRPASLAEYTDWFADAGLAMQVLHLHGNVALLGGAKS